MRILIVLALLAGAAAPRHGASEESHADSVIQHLDLTSFTNRGVNRDSAKFTFADNGFAVVQKAVNAATLLRKSDGLTKSFEILATDSEGVRLCLHDKWVVMPKSPSPMRFDYTTALMVWRSTDRLWQAEVVPGGFMGCINNPSIDPGRRPSQPPSDTIPGLIEAMFPRSHP